MSRDYFIILGTVPQVISSIERVIKDAGRGEREVLKGSVMMLVVRLYSMLEPFTKALPPLERLLMLTDEVFEKVV
jgi:hypothetical protein